MQYRTFQDLNTAVLRHLHKLPPDTDLVVGIPRSGLLAACLGSLHLNVPMTDVQGLLEGRLLSSGRRMGKASDSLEAIAPRQVVVLDDSIQSGSSMRLVREQIEAASLPWNISYGAVFGNAARMEPADFILEVCPRPRIFEWNLYCDYMLTRSCFDIDGVLCRDPSPEENDDGPRYRAFLENAEPLLIPRRPIAHLVTSRLEKYRKPTEAWLTRHGVRHGKLHMLDLPDKATRIHLQAHASFKASVYRDTDTHLFVESATRQALEIAQHAGKPVLSIESNEMIYPGLRPMLQSALSNVPSVVRRRARLANSRLGRMLMRVACAKAT